MSKVISVCNQKGGCGKSNVSVNLAAALVKEGQKVLVVDSDPQGSCTISLGFPMPDEMDYTLADIMLQVVNGEEPDIDRAILHQEEGIDLVPANIALSGLEVSLVNVMSREMILKEFIDKVRDRFDTVIIDCMPSLGVMTINALVAADSVIIPTSTAYLPGKGLQQLLATIGKVKRQLNKNLKIEGILLTMVDLRTVYARDMMNVVLKTYGTGTGVGVFESFIPYSVRAAESSAEGVSIFRHDPDGKVAAAYMDFGKELVSHEKAETR